MTQQEEKYYTALTADGREYIPRYIVEVNPEKCIGCGRCAEVCSRDVYQLQVIENKVVSVPVNKGNCVGDGACRRVCPTKAMR